MANSYNNYNKVGEIFKEYGSDVNVISALESFIVVYKEKQSYNGPKIPLHIFSEKKLGILEAATKYLRENHSMKYCEIAKYLNRKDRTIWASYSTAIKKRKNKFETSEIKYDVPCNVFSNRKLGPLESLVVYLKDDLHLSIHEISKLINRDYMTIYLSYTNGKKK